MIANEDFTSCLSVSSEENRRASYILENEAGFKDRRIVGANKDSERDKHPSNKNNEYVTSWPKEGFGAGIWAD